MFLLSDVFSMNIEVIPAEMHPPPSPHLPTSKKAIIHFSVSSLWDFGDVLAPTAYSLAFTFGIDILIVRFMKNCKNTRQRTAMHLFICVAIWLCCVAIRVITCLVEKWNITSCG